MAERPVFIPRYAAEANYPLVLEKTVTFEWFPGFALSQKQKSIAAFHDSISKTLDISRTLEVSTKSTDAIGHRLSAFVLTTEVAGVGTIPVECAFQGSKVFQSGGPFTDLYEAAPIDARRDPRLKESGPLTGFQLGNDSWDRKPTTAFYDWLYVLALAHHPALLEPLTEYGAFTDIEFNPQKSFNCQARSCALAVALHTRGQLRAALQSQEDFINLAYGAERSATQDPLFR